MLKRVISFCARLLNVRDDILPANHIVASGNMDWRENRVIIEVLYFFGCLSVGLVFVPLAVLLTTKEAEGELWLNALMFQGEKPYAIWIVAFGIYFGFIAVRIILSAFKRRKQGGYAEKM